MFSVAQHKDIYYFLPNISHLSSLTIKFFAQVFLLPLQAASSTIVCIAC